MRPIMDKVHRSFNVSVATLDDDADPAQATSGDRCNRAIAARGARLCSTGSPNAVAVYPRAVLLSHDITEV